MRPACLPAAHKYDRRSQPVSLTLLGFCNLSDSLSMTLSRSTLSAFLALSALCVVFISLLPQPSVRCGVVQLVTCDSCSASWILDSAGQNSVPPVLLSRWCIIRSLLPKPVRGGRWWEPGMSMPADVCPACVLSLPMCCVVCIARLVCDGRLDVRNRFVLLDFFVVPMRQMSEISI